MSFFKPSGNPFVVLGRMFVGLMFAIASVGTSLQFQGRRIEQEKLRQAQEEAARVAEEEKAQEVYNNPFSMAYDWTKYVKDRQAKKVAEQEHSGPFQ